jgi:PAS domain-containing protein
MQNFPPIILNYLDRVLIQDRSPAYLIVDNEGVLAESGGSLAVHGLDHLELGKSVAHQAEFLEGLLPLESSEILLPCLEVSPKHFADVHLLQSGDGDVVLLVDATSAEIQEGLLHQKANDLQILRGHHSQLLKLLTGLEIALLEKVNETDFRVIGTPADWLEHCGLQYMPEKNAYVIAESLDYLHNFVVEAEEFWNTDSGRFKSGPWVQTDPDGTEWYFEATAMRSGRQEIFLIERVAPYSDMRFALLQKAREQSLEYLHLARREKALKEKETRNRILLQAVPDWIFRINGAGIVLDLKATMGKNPSMFTEFIGQPLSEVFPSEATEKIIRCAADAITTQQLQSCHFPLGSSEANIEFEARLVATGENEVVVIIRDVPK